MMYSSCLNYSCKLVGIFSEFSIANLFLQKSMSTLMTAVDMDDRPLSVVGLGVKRNSEAVISVVLGDDVQKKHSSSHSASNRLVGLVAS
jgi:hypothetical protein